MISIKNYVKVKTLEEAFQLNQSKRNCVLGGMLWLRLGKRSIDTAIDLSGLGMDKIEEFDDHFSIGAMTSLRQLEKSRELNSYFNNVIKDAVSDIVGVQFRNLATIGGSIWGRYGFSDLLTVFMSMDSYVQLYKGGVVPLEQFAAMPKDNDILVSIIVNKTPGFFRYRSLRLQRTDFPVLNCAVSGYKGEYCCTVGARPGRAIKIKDERQILAAGITEESIKSFAEYAAENIAAGTNMRGSAEYRTQLAKVLVRRCLEDLQGEYR